MSELGTVASAGPDAFADRLRAAGLVEAEVDTATSAVGFPAITPAGDRAAHRR